MLIRYTIMPLSPRLSSSYYSRRGVLKCLVAAPPTSILTAKYNFLHSLSLGAKRLAGQAAVFTDTFLYNKKGHFDNDPPQKAK
jgi:hypothetical protein